AVGAFRAGCSVDGHRMEMMILPENHFGERPPPLGELSPLRGFIEGNDLFASLLADKTLRYMHRQDRFDARSLAMLLRWAYKGPGLDAGLFVASLPDRQGVVILPPLGELTRLLSEDEINIELDHRRYTMLGHAGATSLGSWLFKWEMAGEILRNYNTGDPKATIPSLDVQRGTLLTGMLGITYGGFADTQLTLEAQRGVFIDRPDDLLFPVDAPIFAARAMHRALRERLTLLGVATAIGLTAQYGWLARAEATYKLEEFITGFQVTLGYVHYSPGDPDEFSPFYGFDAHDRVFARLRWDFTAL
ncbi:MAG: hypothetical protein KC620_14375, partial [Myxococcales bacterium]|nr:hypothetical protein [Myxococcales bacterium]